MRLFSSHACELRRACALPPVSLPSLLAFHSFCYSIPAALCLTPGLLLLPILLSDLLPLKLCFFWLFYL